MPKPIKVALLIDDEEIDQRQYQRVIKKSGLVERVVVFTYADDALEYILSNPQVEVDVIFLDINMPRMNGLQFLEAASRQLGPGFAKIVVAMLTTSLNPSDQERALEFDAVKEFIHKPLTVEHVQKVAEMLSPAE